MVFFGFGRDFFCCESVFRDSVVDNLTDFFERFRSLNVRSSAQTGSYIASGVPSSATKWTSASPGATATGTAVGRFASR